MLRLLRLGRVGALECARTPRPWTRRGDRAPSCGRRPRRGFVLARNHGRCSRSRGRCARRRARPERGRRADARRRQRDGLPDLHRVAAGGPARRARRPRSPTRPACARTRGCRWPTSSAELRFLAADGTELSREQREIGEFTWLGTLDPASRRSRSTRRSRAERAGEHVIGCSGVGPPPAHARRRGGLRRASSRFEPDADPGEALFAPPQHGVPVTLAAGQAVAVVLRREVAARGFDLVTLQLNVEPPFGRRRARARGRARARRRRGDRRRRHDAGGRERGLRPLLARAARAARTSSSAASTTPTRRRSWSSTRARRC